MKLCRLSGAFAVVGIWLATLPSVGAHRVDEYLQATRLSVDIKRVDLEIDLTAGIALASEVFGWIDANRDGAISKAEGDAYAREMLGAVVLSIDGRTVPVALVEASYPPFLDMSLGMGTIRLRAIAKVSTTGAGRHEIAFLNGHRPASSVYLVNVLVPANPRIQLADQRRDHAQHGLTLDYTVSAGAPPVWIFGVLAGLVLAVRWFLRYRHVIPHSGPYRARRTHARAD